MRLPRRLLPLAALLALWLAGCGPSPNDPRLLRGTFRSKQPVIAAQGLYRQIEFLENEAALTYFVDASGRATATAPAKQKFRVTGETIEFVPAEPRDPNVFYLPLRLTYMTRDRLKMADTGEILARVQP